MALDSILYVGIQGDASGLKAAMEQSSATVQEQTNVIKGAYQDASATVREAYANMASASQTFGAAAAAGNTAAIAQLQNYVNVLGQAQVAQANLAAGLATLTPAVNNAGQAANNSSVMFLAWYAAIRLARAGLKEIEDVSTLDNNLRLVSEATGVSVLRLGELKGAGDLAGIAGERLIAVVTRLSRATELSKEGIAKTTDELRRMGITATDPIERLKQLSDTYRNAADKSEALAITQQLVSSTGSGLSLSQQQLAGFLSEGSAQITKNMEESRDYATALEEAQANTYNFISAKRALDQAFQTNLLENMSLTLFAFRSLGTVIIYTLEGVRQFTAGIEQIVTKAKASLSLVGEITKDAFSRDWSKLASDYQAGTDKLWSIDENYHEKVNKIGAETKDLYDKLWANKPLPPTAGGTDRIPDPANNSGNKTSEKEETEELAHIERMADIQRQAAASEATIAKEATDAVIALMESKHDRAIALSLAEEDASRAKLEAENQINAAAYASAIKVLNDLETLQKKDGKNALTEIAATEGEKLKLRDGYVKATEKLYQDLSSAEAKFIVVGVTESREAADETAKFLATSMKTTEAEFKRAGEELRKVNDLKLNVKADVQDEGLAKQKLEIEQAYALSLDHSVGALYQEQAALLAVDRQIQQINLDRAAAVVHQDVNAGYGPNTTQFQQDQIKLVTIAKQSNAAIITDTTHMQLTLHNSWATYFNQLNQGFAASIAKMLTGQRGFVASMDTLFTQMATQFIQKAIMMTTAHIIQNLIRVGSTVTSNAAIQASNGLTMQQTISQGAAKAAIGAYDAIVGIPIVGPVLAPIAATVAGAAVYALGEMAAFAAGGIVPNTGIALVHGGESVLPAPLTSMLTSTANSGGAQGGGFTNHGGININNPGSAASGKKIGSDVMKQLQYQVRRSNMKIA